MQVQNTRQNQALWAATQAANTKTDKTSQEAENAVETTAKTDIYTKSGSAKEAVYEEPKRLTADQLKQISEQRIQSFTNMMQGMFGKQVDFFNKATYANLKIDPQTAAQAQAAISDGGEWSSDAVSSRLLDMAKALSGGDAKNIPTLRNAVQKGFQEAAKAWGGKLPGICDDTYDKVMKGFDDWEKESAQAVTA